ncbi:MAG: hypothetical protein WAV23_04290 [Minisyncoccia bacterium]
MTIEWQALEHEEIEHTTDWFWALGIIVVASSVTAIIFSNYFFAFILILSGVMLGFFATKKPDMVTYELNDKGLKINTQFYPYKNIKSFWVQTEPKPTLFLKLDRFYMPMISIPIEENKAGEIKDLLLEKEVLEEEMKEHMSEKIMNTLGF